MVKLRPHLDQAYSLLSAVLAAVNRENPRHNEADPPQLVSPRYVANLEVLRPQVRLAETNFKAAAQRDAQSLYGRGMIWGTAVVAIISLMAFGAIAIADLPAWYVIAFPAGALGGVMSVLQRMTFGQLELDYTAGKPRLMFVGAFRPIVGGVFGMVIFALFAGEILGTVVAANDVPLGFYAGVGFFSGFNERFAQDAIAGSTGPLINPLA